ncbi:type II toxin-antitoxin system VapC family toxin [Roseibacillus ishigakijimensis]|uniref:Type II toxin-antitoxin system VapC family toxin n=1 Tax=Roseibacillus ishigakijimensis TaxID=454146 RepID=A0A934RQU3_9BACT|nr:type II toxin-antitoxin system VapC family toxin [Roseibacillus ishigakijimensis]MBK1835223.1 type II toxin-antitoxin system VapC family toxin [Roseibacillus ishigakijimensis]
MRVYPDTSFLCSLYRKQVHTPVALSYVRSQTEPILVSSFLVLEFRQSVRLQGWIHERNPSQGFSLFETDGMLRDFQSDLRTGIWKMVSPDWAEVHQLGEAISRKHTAVSGNRLVDILHLATALHLGCETFLSFDKRQQALATAEGLRLGV